MKKLALILLSTLLIGCTDNSPEVKWICPLGAPAICFFDQGNNDSFVTSPPTSIVPLFQKKNSEYDALIIDSRTGLLQSKKYQSSFKFAKLLTAGNLYLVGLNDNASKPTSESKIVAFQENAIPGLVFKKIIKEYFHLENSISYVDEASLISPIMKSGLYQGSKIDFVLAAEPMLYNVSHNPPHKIATYKVSLRSIWKELTNQDEIPQASLFINKDSINVKKNKLKTFLSDIDRRVNTALTNPNEVTNSLNGYGDNNAQSQRFGFSSDKIVGALENNGLALYSKEYTCDMMNAFLSALGLENYTNDDFIKID